MRENEPGRTVLASRDGSMKLISPCSSFDEDVAILRSHKETLRYLPFLPQSMSIEDIRERRESRANQDTIFDLYILLCEEEEKIFVGMCGLFNIDRRNDSCSIGILISPDYFRRGLATEALYLLMKYTFENDSLHMHRVVYETGADNIQMRGWLENVVGADMEFRWREAWKAPEGWVDAIGYSVLDREWKTDVEQRLRSRIASTTRGSYTSDAPTKRS